MRRFLKAAASRRERTKCSTLVPRGYVPVYVADEDKEMKLFLVHATSFYDAESKELLFKSAHECGYENQGVLKISFDARIGCIGQEQINLLYFTT